MAGSSSPDVTVIICTHDRPHYLAACLAGLCAQVLPRDRRGAFEVLVVDSASPQAGAQAIAALAAAHHARLVVADRPGLSHARNLGADRARGRWLAYIDDDAVPDPDWVAEIIAEGARARPPGAMGGIIRPHYEAPLPAWWPKELEGTLTILRHDQAGEVGADLPPGVEPYGANFIVRRDALLRIGGFPEGLGRVGKQLLSGEESLVLRRLAEAGEAIRYQPGIAVTHHIQAPRLSVPWLLRRMYWQGVSEAVLRRLVGNERKLWRDAPRRLAVALLYGPLLLTNRDSPRFLRRRWRAAYATGYLRGMLRRRA